MFINFLFFIIIITSLILFIFLFTSSNIKETLKNNQRVVNCNGCLDEQLKCHPGTNPVCSNTSNTLCNAFYDENGNKRTPCGLFDTFDNVEESCKNCTQYCEYCIGPDKKGRCIGRNIFNCKFCPYSRKCQENVFNIYIPHKG